MLIHVADSGLSYELQCGASSSVEEVQSYLASLTGVPQPEQLLIVGDTRLEPQRLLGWYRLPQDARPVFLFNRHRLTPDSPAPPPEGPERFAEAEAGDLPPPPPPPAGRHPLDDSADPALRALPSYEREFRYHLDKGRAVLGCSQKKLELCRMLLREQQVQEMALETARANMEHYYKMIDQLYTEFMRHFTRQHRQHSELLASFDRDLERLRTCKLHPALWTATRTSLIDCVKEASLRKWADDCGLSHKQFSAKVSQLKNEYMVLQRSVEDLLVTGSTVNVRLLEETIEAHVRCTEEQASIVQSLSKDVNTVTKLMDDCVSSQYTASMRPHDAVSALGPMYDVHDRSHIPRVQACDAELRKLLGTCRRSKNEMSMAVHMRMQNVAALQANIRDMRNQLSAFKEAMARQDDIFEELKVVRKVSSAYKACLAEVVRRKACMKLYMGQAGQLAEKLARKRELEVARREEFLQAQSAYIPRDVLAAMGLFDSPSQCIVNIAPFDVGLLDLDVADIERCVSAGALCKLGGDEEACPPGGPRTCERDWDVDEIAGTSKLEVENTWLKAELASAIAMLCSLDPEYEQQQGALEGGEVDEADAAARVAAKMTAEALRRKDAHAQQLHGILGMRQYQCQAYEKRIGELEARLREQDNQIQKLSSASGKLDQPGLSDKSEVVEPMDEGVTSRRPLASSSCSEADRDESMGENAVPTDFPMAETCKSSAPKEVGGKMSSLEDAVNDRTTSEEQLKQAMQRTIDQLRSELECNGVLLRECQMNSAHLENRLHEAKEEARVSGERRAAEHASLRNSCMRLRGLIERLKNCISAPLDGTTAFAESLRALSASMAANSGGNEQGEEPGVEFASSVHMLADRITALVQQRAEALDRCSSLEASQGQLNKEIESKAEMLKNLYDKHKLEKQVSKEKICFTRFELHELAMFVHNAAGHWEAVNRNCPNYYLSDESIALFMEHAPSEQQYIVGRIVHINKNTARLPPASEKGSRSRYNPYDLPVGCEYFVVTVAL